MENPDIVFKYFKTYLNRGFGKIFNEQQNIAQNKIYGVKAYSPSGKPRTRSGNLQTALENPQVTFTGSGASLEFETNYPKYIRFLDMKRIGNYKIYNRPIWGILYKETLRDIRYEFSDWLRAQVGDALRDALTQK